MTRWQILSALTQSGPAWITLDDGRTGILQSVQRESGSGRDFNLTILLGKEFPRTTEMIYVHTTD